MGNVPMFEFLAVLAHLEEDNANSLFDRVADVCSTKEPFVAAARPLRWQFSR